MTGRLIYVIGASGSGKDTLLSVLRKDEFFYSSFVFSHRYITRPSHLGSENHVELSHAEFVVRGERGLFALEWQAHETRYGIGREIDLWMKAGMHVVVNGSREYLSEVERLYPNVLPIWITVDSDVLMQRLIARGRESLIDIECRVQRNRELETLRPDDCLSLDNSGDIESVLATLKALISSKI